MFLEPLVWILFGFSNVITAVFAFKDVDPLFRLFSRQGGGDTADVASTKLGGVGLGLFQREKKE